MRTTVDIDQDLLDAIRARAHQSGRSVREELNRALVRGLRTAVGVQPTPYRSPTARLGLRPGIDLDKALALAGSLEDEETTQQLRQFR